MNLHDLHVKKFTTNGFSNGNTLDTNGRNISTPIVITDESDNDGAGDSQTEQNEGEEKEDREIVENHPTIFVVDSEGTAFIRRKGTVGLHPPDVPGETLVCRLSEMVRSKAVDTDLIRTLLEHLGGDDLTGILADLVTDKELDMIRLRKEKQSGACYSPDNGPPVRVISQTSVQSVSSCSVISNIIENELLREKEYNEDATAEESSVRDIVETDKETDDDIIIPRLSSNDTMDDLVDLVEEEKDRSGKFRLTNIANLLVDPVAGVVPDNIINLVNQVVDENEDEDDEIEIISATVSNKITTSRDLSPKTSPHIRQSSQRIPSAVRQISPVSLPLMPDLTSLVQPNLLSLPSDQVVRSLLYPVTEDNPLLQLATCRNPWNLPPDLAVYEELLRTRLAATRDSNEYGRLAAQYEDLIRVCRQRQRRAEETRVRSPATLVPMDMTRPENGPVTLVPVSTRTEHGQATLVPVGQTAEMRVHTRPHQSPATLVPVKTRPDWVPATLVPVSQTRAPVIVSTRSLGPTVRLEKVSHDSKGNEATNRKQKTGSIITSQKENPRSLPVTPRTPTLRQRKQKVDYQDPESPEESPSSSSDESDSSVKGSEGAEKRGIKRGLAQDQIIEELSDKKRNKNMEIVGELELSGSDNNVEEMNENRVENNHNNVSQFVRNNISDSSEDLVVGVEWVSNNKQQHRNKRKVKKTLKRRESSSSGSSDSEDHSARAKRVRAFQAFKNVRSHSSRKSVDSGKISCRPTQSDVEEGREGEPSRIRRSLEFSMPGDEVAKRRTSRKNVIESDSDKSWKADDGSEEEEDESDDSFIVDEMNHPEGSHNVAAESVWSEGGWSEIIDGLKRKSDKYQELTCNYEESLNYRQLGGYDHSDEDGDKENKYPPRLLENLREAVQEAMEDDKELNSAPFDDNDFLIQQWQLYDVQENPELEGECICGRTGLRWLYFMRIRSTVDWRFHTRIVGSECIKWFCRSKPNSILTCVSRFLKEGCLVTFRSRLDSGLLLFSLGGTILPPFMLENQELHSTEYITPGVSVSEETGEVDIAVRPGTRDRVKDTAGNILAEDKKYQAWLKPLIKPSKERKVPVMEFVLVRIDDLSSRWGQVGPKAQTAKDFIKLS